MPTTLEELRTSSRNKFRHGLSRIHCAVTPKILNRLLEERQKGIEISGFDRESLAAALGVPGAEIAPDVDSELMDKILVISTATNIVRARFQEVIDGILYKVTHTSLTDLEPKAKAAECINIVERLQHVLRAQKENDKSMSKIFGDAVATLPSEQRAAAIAYIQEYLGSEI